MGIFSSRRAATSPSSNCPRIHAARAAASSQVLFGESNTVCGLLLFVASTQRPVVMVGFSSKTECVVRRGAWYQVESDLFSSEETEGAVWLGSPLSACIELGTFCNFECPFCLSASGANGERSSRWVPAALVRWRDLAGASRIVWSGGEPSLFPDLLDLVHKSAALGNINIIATNGTQAINVTAADWVDVSLYGSDDAMYLRHTGRRLSRRVWENIELMARSAAPRISVNLILGMYGRDAVDQMVRRAASVGVRRIKFHRPLLKGRATQLPSTAKVNREIAAARQVCAEEGVLASYPLCDDETELQLGYYVLRAPGAAEIGDRVIPLGDADSIETQLNKCEEANSRVFLTSPNKSQSMRGLSHGDTSDLDRQSAVSIESLMQSRGWRNVVVFGSTGRGDRLDASDLDVVVVDDSAGESWNYSPATIGGRAVDLNRVSTSTFERTLTRCWEWRVALEHATHFGESSAVRDLVSENCSQLREPRVRRTLAREWQKTASRYRHLSRSMDDGWCGAWIAAQYLSLLVDCAIWLRGGTPFCPEKHLGQASACRDDSAISTYVDRVLDRDSMSGPSFLSLRHYFSDTQILSMEAHSKALVLQGHDEYCSYAELAWASRLLPREIAKRSGIEMPSRWSAWPQFVSEYVEFVPHDLVAFVSERTFAMGEAIALGRRVDEGLA